MEKMLREDHPYAIFCTNTKKHNFGTRLENLGAMMIVIGAMMIVIGKQVRINAVDEKALLGNEKMHEWFCNVFGKVANNS